MTGSKRGKHLKSKGKPKSKKLDTINNRPEIFNSEPDSAQMPTNNPDGLNDCKDKNYQPNMNLDMTTSVCKYTEDEMEEFRFSMLEELYTEAFDWLLKSGYRFEVVQSAVLNNGHVRGPMDPLNNVLSNAIAFIENQVEPERGPFKAMKELYRYMLDFLVDFVMQNFLSRRSDAMCNLLIRKWEFDPSTTMSTHQQCGHQNMSNILVYGSYGSCGHNKDDDGFAIGSYSASEKVPSESNIDSSVKKVGILKRINHTPALAYMLKEKIPSHNRQKTGYWASVANQQGIPSDSSKIKEASDILGPDFLMFDL